MRFTSIVGVELFLAAHLLVHFPMSEVPTYQDLDFWTGIKIAAAPDGFCHDASRDR